MTFTRVSLPWARALFFSNNPPRPLAIQSLSPLELLVLDCISGSLSVSPQLTAGNVTNESRWMTDLISLACLSHEAQPWISWHPPIYRAQHSYLYSQLLGTIVSLRQCTTAFICLLNKYLLSIYSVPVNMLSSENATVNGEENVPEFMFKGKEIRR